MIVNPLITKGLSTEHSSLITRGLGKIAKIIEKIPEIGRAIPVIIESYFSLSFPISGIKTLQVVERVPIFAQKVVALFKSFSIFGNKTVELFCRFNIFATKIFQFQRSFDLVGEIVSQIKASYFVQATKLTKFVKSFGCVGKKIIVFQKSFVAKGTRNLIKLLSALFWDVD